MLLLFALLVLAVLVAFLGIVLVNLWVLPTVTRFGNSTSRERKVALLVPARNEAANIEACLRSLLQQDYAGLEVWLYDDASTDGTAEIATRIGEEDRPAGVNLHIVSGTVGPPSGWLGKANACHRLYAAMMAESDPDYVLFTDADVRFAPSAVSQAVAAADSLGAGLLSIFPRQVTISWAERLAVPILLHWAVYNFLPLPLAFSKRTGPAFAAANGQFMLFKREAYEACGGHAAVRSEILEDVALARAVKRAGYRAMLADGGPLVHTRMYNGPGEVWQGYSKNAYAFFGYSPVFLAIGIVVLLVLYVLPLLLAAFFLPTVVGFVFLAQYVTAVLTRLALAVRFRYPLLDMLLHPVAIVYMIAIEVNSMVWALTGRGNWKGRGVRSEGQ
ncbi:MAG: glycosyltransferase [Chloroflexota bacterium]